ncbi:MAG: penicillin-insensitive murein endopeptidase [Deltaproteobacteria bacterium]|jgi:penicillin-insensitive murein endopeptidase|nr:penicillin-insensitive murein endopeptidase [Deltaproteobacteria bacterium]MBW2535357.1 penicillin-insensitive murein endopeptidase [Deltaproteobacteria bacterium]
MKARSLAVAALLSLGCVAGTQQRASAPTGPGATSGPSESPRRTLTDPAELEPETAAAKTVAVRPLDLDDAELQRRIRDDLASLGPMSLGRPNAGALINGALMPEGDHWEIVSPHTAWGTQETIDSLIRAIELVNEQFPNTHKLFVGDISRELGGPLRPHRSHHAGRDVDVSYYYRPDRAAWYQRAGQRTLDLDRTWALVRALITETDVEMMFIDRRVQKLLKEHALSLGEDRSWLDAVFQYGSRRGPKIIRHTWGHATHIHIRFYSPEAQKLGQRSFEQLAELGLITPRHHTVRYQARGGDTVQSVAHRAGTSVGVLRQMNGLRRGNLVAGRTYLVPLRGRVARVRDAVIPPRLLPPPPAASGLPVAAAVAP